MRITITNDRFLIARRVDTQCLHPNACWQRLFAPLNERQVVLVRRRVAVPEIDRRHLGRFSDVVNHRHVPAMALVGPFRVGLVSTSVASISSITAWRRRNEVANNTRLTSFKAS